MSNYTYGTAPVRLVEANRIRFGDRRFGSPKGVPVVLNQHFKGTMDYWDPAVTGRPGQDPGSHPVRQSRHRIELQRSASL
jgi:hypothetical protein